MKPMSLSIVGGPSIAPGTIYGIGRNYAEHAAELRHDVPSEPIVFLKSLASLRGLSEGPLAYPGETFHHEAELVVLVGRGLARGHKAAWDDVAALALGLDLTRREAQNLLKAKGLPWTKAKAFDGAAPLSPFLPKDLFPNLDAIEFTLHVGSQLRQKGNTQDMLFPVISILDHLLSFTSLFAGDVIFTGTPSGVGPIQHGETFTLAFPSLNRQFAGRL